MSTFLKSRCHVCNKKVPTYLIDTEVLKCRCNNIYCSVHIHKHECSFNYSELHKIYIKKQLPKVDSQKIIII